MNVSWVEFALSFLSLITLSSQIKTYLSPHSPTHTNFSCTHRPIHLLLITAAMVFISRWSCLCFVKGPKHSLLLDVCFFLFNIVYFYPICYASERLSRKVASVTLSWAAAAFIAVGVFKNMFYCEEWNDIKLYLE